VFFALNLKDNGALMPHLRAKLLEVRCGRRKGGREGGREGGRGGRKRKERA